MDVLREGLRLRDPDPLQSGKCSWVETGPECVVIGTTSTHEQRRVRSPRIGVTLLTLQNMAHLVTPGFQQVGYGLVVGLVQMENLVTIVFEKVGFGPFCQGRSVVSSTFNDKR